MKGENADRGQWMILLAFFAGILWGSCGIFVRTLSESGLNNVSILAVRVLGAVILLGGGMLAAARSCFRIRIRDLWLFAGAGLGGTFGLNICYNFAIRRLTLSLAAVLLGLCPVFVLFFSAILFGERITVKKIGCMLLAFCGCILVSGIFESGHAGQWSPAGILVGILSAFFYGIYSIMSRLAMDRGYPVYTVVFYSALSVLIALLLVADWRTVGKFVATAPAAHVLFLVLHSLCTSVLPYLFYTMSLHRVDPGMVSIVASGAEPAAATIFGFLVYAEHPTVLSAIGLIVVIVAIALLCKTPKNPENAGGDDMY